MKTIVTLTLNPAVDKSTFIASLKPNSKLRCAEPVYEAGGGGINVSRAIKELGGSSLAMYFAGGPTGEHLKNLLTNEGVLNKFVSTEGWTRENLSVTDNATNLQYRFGMPGSKVSEKEAEEILEKLEIQLINADYLVASGSLPPGLPNDFYVKVASIAKKNKVKCILDTSGEALVEGAKGDVFLLKPNLAELSAMCGVKSVSAMELEKLARKFLQNNSCEVLVVSLGPKGAMLITEEQIEQITAPTVHQKSTVGAGDSMLAGMVLSLVNGKSYKEMLAFGIACGTAATMTPGTQLCKKEDVEKLYDWLLKKEKIFKK